MEQAEFEDKLAELIDEYLAAGGTRGEARSAMELKLMAMNEEEGEDGEG